MRVNRSSGEFLGPPHFFLDHLFAQASCQNVCWLADSLRSRNPIEQVRGPALVGDGVSTADGRQMKPRNLGDREPGRAKHFVE